MRLLGFFCKEAHHWEIATEELKTNITNKEEIKPIFKKTKIKAINVVKKACGKSFKIFIIDPFQIFIPHWIILIALPVQSHSISLLSKEK